MEFCCCSGSAKCRCNKTVRRFCRPRPDYRSPKAVTEPTGSAFRCGRRSSQRVGNALLSQRTAIAEKPITGSRTDDISRTAGFAAAAAKRSAFHRQFAVTASRRKSKSCCQLTAVSNEITGVGTNEIGTGSMLFSDVDAAGRCTAL